MLRQVFLLRYFASGAPALVLTHVSWFGTCFVWIFPLGSFCADAYALFYAFRSYAERVLSLLVHRTLAPFFLAILYYIVSRLSSLFVVFFKS